MTCAGHALLAPNVADSSSDEEDEEEEDSPAADKRLVPVHSLLRADVIGLYFGAGRSKPSRKFERLLHKAYAKLAPGAGDAQGGKDGKEEAARRLEVVYVSHDHSSEEFKCASNASDLSLRGFGSERLGVVLCRSVREVQPWLSLPWGDKRQKARLCHAYQVANTPAFVLIDRNGHRLSLSGVEALEGDPACDKFPWDGYQHVYPNSLRGDVLGALHSLGPALARS